MKGFQALAKRKRTAGAAVVAVVAKWKVGDLVLTKMKGFQAWPAMVSASSQQLLILYSLIYGLPMACSVWVQGFLVWAGVSRLGFGGGRGRPV